MRTRTEVVVEAGDGTRLYARQTVAAGATGVPLLCANGIGVSTIFWRYVEDHFSRERPVICWDYRGHGNSEFPRDLDDLTMQSNAEDMRRVLDAFGHERAVLLGHSMGCQVIYEMAHRHPERVAGLVPMLGTHGRPIHTFLDMEVGSLISFLIGHRIGMLIPDTIARGKRALFGGGAIRRFISGFARLSGLVQATMPQEDLDAYLDHFALQSPLVFIRMAEKMATHSAGPHLGSIRCPVLVVAGERDVFTPLWCSEEIVERLPHGRLVILKDGSHAALVEQPAAVQREVAAFLAEHRLDQRAVAAPAPATSAA